MKSSIGFLWIDLSCQKVTIKAFPKKDKTFKNFLRLFCALLLSFIAIVAIVEVVHGLL